MKRLIGLALVCLIGLQARAADEASAEKVSVEPVSLSEQRFRGIDGEGPRFGGGDELEIVLRVHGPGVEKATSYGHVKVERAVDDLGNDLKPDRKGPPSFGEDRFVQIDARRSGMLKKDESGFRMKMRLKSAARKASTIQVKGEFQVLAGGRPLTVTVKNVSSQTGKQLDDPQLKEAGVQVKVLEPTSEADTSVAGVRLKGLPLEIKGAVWAVRKVELLDKTGKNLIEGQFTQHLKDEQKVTYQLLRPLDDTMTLKMQLLAGQRMVKVPFELKDVELP